MNVVHRICRTPAVALERFGHEPSVPHRDPEREKASGHAINFVCSGSFRVSTDGAWRAVTPDCLFVTTPGLEFSCTHDEEYPQDECLSVLYSESAIESLRSAGAGAALATRAARAPLCELTNRRAYLRHGLGQCAVTSPAVDAAQVEALAGALYWTLGEATSRRPLYRAPRLAWHASRVDRAKEWMRSEFAEPLTLSRMAGEVGMSLYPFARLFAELEGVTPHRYLVGVRLAEAARRLRAGGSVTEVCFAVGFGSLSHFTTTFRRKFGMPPSEFQRAPTAPS